MSVIERPIRAVDRFQQGHRSLAFPFAVFKKFGEDQAGNLAALIAYYGFFSLFPLLLVLVTVLGLVLQNNPDLQKKILDSALSQFPVIGDQLKVGSISGSGLALAVGIVTALWAGLGVVQAFQNAMNTVWGVPMVARPNFIKSRLRSVAMLAVLGVGIVVAALLGGVTAGRGGDWYLVVGGIAASLVLNIALFLLAFKVLTVAKVSWRDVLPGAIIAGVAWAILQAVGGYIVGHQLKNASATYGALAFVIVLLFWIYLGAQMTLLAAEANTVKAKRLWPRSLLQPPLTEEDKRALAEQAVRETRRPEEVVDVRFNESGEPQPDQRGFTS